MDRDQLAMGGTGADTPAIVTRALSKRFGTRRGPRRRGSSERSSSPALDGLDLEVCRGEVFGFLGPNGAGKTTTIRLLLDLIRPTGGSATVLGLDPRRDGVALRARLGYLPGDVNLPPRLNGREYLADHARIRGLDLTAAIGALADRLGADLDRPMGDLSLGNRRKVALIDAFVHRPELLVLDEPTGGLDPLVQQTFRTLAREAAAEGRTVFLSSHVLDEVQHVADRVAVLRDGRLVADDRVDVLLGRLSRSFRVRFAEVPPLDAFGRVPGVVSIEVSRDGATRGGETRGGETRGGETRGGETRGGETRGGEVVFDFRGDAGPLLDALAPWHPLDLRSHEPDLEDLFLGYYGTTDAERDELVPAVDADDADEHDDHDDHRSVTA